MAANPAPMAAMIVIPVMTITNTLPFSEPIIFLFLFSKNAYAIKQNI
jgi:hypothetical protein